MAVLWQSIPCRLSSTIPACKETIGKRERERDLGCDISRCNTVSQDYPQEGLVRIRARFNIPAGEEITTSYIRPTQDTQARRQLLAHTWHFWCHCHRCRDNTEGGTFLSAILCNICGVGPMLPQHPLDTDSSWTCERCQASITHEEQEALLQRSLQVNFTLDCFLVY